MARTSPPIKISINHNSRFNRAVTMYATPNGPLMVQGHGVPVVIHGVPVSYDVPAGTLRAQILSRKYETIGWNNDSTADN